MTTTSVLHLSDLHIKSDRSAAENRHARRLVQWIVAERPESTVVVSGDIVDNGAQSEFDAAKALLDPLGERLFVCPGNHDYAKLGNIFDADAVSRFRDTFDIQGRFPVGRFDSQARVAVFGVDTADVDDDVWFARGQVGDEQLQKLVALLDDHAAYARVVVMHHHPFYRGFFVALKDSDELMQALRGRCELLLFGHKHASDFWDDTDELGVPWIFSSGKSTRPAVTVGGERALRFREALIDSEDKRIDWRWCDVPLAGEWSLSPAVRRAGRPAAPIGALAEPDVPLAPALLRSDDDARDDVAPAASVDAAPRAAAGAARSAIRERLGELIGDQLSRQYLSPADFPRENERSFVVGAYPAWVQFYLGNQRDDLDPFGEQAEDCSGSSFMGLWFLSQSHQDLLRLVERGDEGADQLLTLADAIMTQLRNARDLPRFYQGDPELEDIHGCPEWSMGWYPLTEPIGNNAGYRLPSILPNCAESILAHLAKGMSNRSDGDIWAWCRAIDSTTPGVQRYHHAIERTRAVAALLGQPSQWPDALHEHSIEVYEALRGEVPDGEQPDDLPLGTFYNTDDDYKQRYSCVVMANVLSSVALLPIPPDLRPAVDACASFVRDATIALANGTMTPLQYAYDYDTIPSASVAYVLRAHKRMAEIGTIGFSELLDWEALDAAAKVLVEAAQAALDEPIQDARAYASRAYAFNGAMNLRWFERFNAAGTDRPNPEPRFPDALTHELASSLLRANEASYRAPGTGPYHLIGPLWADMASPCFIAPPLVEAYVLYLWLSYGSAG